MLRRKTDVFYDCEGKTLFAEIEVPDLTALQVLSLKERKHDSLWTPVASRSRKLLIEKLLYSICIRAGFLIAKSDSIDMIDAVAINVRQHWFDPTTGAKREGVIASMHATKPKLISLQMEHIEPKACFRHLKGISTPSVEKIAEIRPIFELNTNDHRLIRGKDVSQHLEAEANLAEMPWDDFEHLVRQLFEWEFGEKGIEVKVTRASRDRGVDAMMFDPDPLRGGKYVLQAKRYSRTVDVAAVRDLYGTIMNEGANRGILVTTSSYGPDSYDFAKDKPISLVDGQNLLAILRRHGRNYRIDLTNTSSNI